VRPTILTKESAPNFKPYIGPDSSVDNDSKSVSPSLLMAESDLHGLPTGFEDTPRPAKRRKFYRKRVNDDEPENSATAASETPPVKLTLEELVITRGVLPETELQEENSAISVADIIRQRKAAQRKRAGIEFTNTTTASKSGPATPSLSKALIEKDEIAADLEAVVNRFAPQTGQVADVDKHM